MRAFNHSVIASALLHSSITLPLVAAGGCFDPVTSPFDSSDWSHCQPIPSDTHELYLYYTPLEDTVLLGFHALDDTDGWTALGINGNGGMKGATFIVVRQESDGTWIAEDRHAEDYEMPSLDEQQDVRLLFAEQENGQTAWGVAVPKNSCDLDGNDYEILDRLTNLLWAVGSDHNFGYHAQRGQFQANLLQAPEEPASTEGLSSVELRMPNVTVVLGEGGSDPTNPYICTYLDLEEIAAKEGFSVKDSIHVTQFSPKLNEESKHYVHHMILYACDAESAIGVEHLQVLPECASMPEGCLEMKYVWAVGGKDTLFPEDVGLPIGGKFRFLVLQMHYYNPSLDQGVVDSSGVEVYYTTDLKEQEVGVLQLVGATSQWQNRGPLPAGQERVSISFVTPSECTQSVWTEPLNILGVGHHLHTYGIYQEISVVRNGDNLGTLRPEYHYDFKHQAMDEPVPSIRQLLPGDQINQICKYDTRNAPEDIEFGDYTQQEMCYTAIYYYPRQEAETFGSMPVWFDADTCSQPAYGAAFKAADLSLCAESLYNNVPAFYRFEDEVPTPFDLLTACNGGDLFQDLFYELPYICPDCQKTASCTAEEVAMHASGVCAFLCDGIGMSLYPDLNRTKAPEYGNFGCDPGYFTIPSIPDAPACQASGTSSLDSIEVNDIVLKNVSAGTTDGETPSTEGSKENIFDEPSTDTKEKSENGESVKDTDNSASTKISMTSSIIVVLCAAFFMH